jgi:hypothetical protein
MKESQTESKSVWQKTPVSNLVRYVPSGILFARMKVKGKLIRRSLKSKSLSVGKLRLSDLEKQERQMAENASSLSEGKMTFGDALQIYRQRLHGDASLKAAHESTSRGTDRRPPEDVAVSGNNRRS